MTSGEVSVTFVEPSDIAALNQRHLDRVGPTDVLAFQLGEPDAPLGDIYICPDRARESALEYDLEAREELLRLVVHGTLHVLGHEHPDGPDRESSEMFRRQEEILACLL
ncbi:MAG: rRNA maturation RNase YbeY [Gemmatimonadetes bacterium]|nr:rRNA maturation RNase YbeY [Gemmatimonadota bacterium]NIT68970.1 rRNA maturation RNase YbeY [Gemmatimonadota bacterium]NIV25238.1 rRNA maturation RNase YbeY [Gemmatimonadota bacterium]NIW36238.1 rRNA maturation RNase YbeY [Gemmatimonadota bacterium]NIW77242.1 rRNA maturation RNase YbeY [Gemmatimonadota bacterium]